MHHAAPTVRCLPLRRAALCAGLALSAVTVLADADGEREALARLVHELEVLSPLIREAEAQAVPDARVRFRYDWLRQDLAIVRGAVQRHIDAPRNQPRPFPPLRGDYRQ